MHHYIRVEGGDAHWKLYWLPVVTVEAEHQEGGEIVRAWIADPKVYCGIQNTNAPMMVFVS